MQLREYEGMVRRDAPADRSHVEALLRLVGRRPDADLVFADAGRRAARRAVRRLFVLTRLAARAGPRALDRKSTRLNSSHTVISYAVFCLKKKKKKTTTNESHHTTR